jgi:hypothetical protein
MGREKNFKRGDKKGVSPFTLKGGGREKIKRGEGLA